MPLDVWYGEPWLMILFDNYPSGDDWVSASQS